MELLYVLEGLRMPGLNEFMLLITRFGEETAFLVAALVVYWCVDKKKGYYLMAVGFAGTMLNQALKLAFRVPRPWVLDPDFTILEAAREAAAGYSFPSGHTQSAVGTFGGLALVTEKRSLRWLFAAIAVLVPISRMYVGVHTPADVGAAAAMALVLVLGLRFMVVPGGAPKRYRVMLVLTVMALCLLIFVTWYPWMDAVDEHNLNSGIKNAWTMLGCTAGMLIVWPVERKYIRFETKAPLPWQVGKILLGLALVLMVKEGLRAPLEAVLPVYPARMVRYFAIVLTAGIACPWIFMKIGAKKHELRSH